MIKEHTNNRKFKQHKMLKMYKDCEHVPVQEAMFFVRAGQDCMRPTSLQYRLLLRWYPTSFNQYQTLCPSHAYNTFSHQFVSLNLRPQKRHTRTLYQLRQFTQSLAFLGLDCSPTKRTYLCWQIRPVNGLVHIKDYDMPFHNPLWTKPLNGRICQHR